MHTELKPGKPVFYDEYLRCNERYLRDQREQVNTNNGDRSLEMIAELSFESARRARVFFIDGYLTESLADVCPIELFGQDLDYLPFPDMFFELENPIQIQEKRIKAIKFSTEKNELDILKEIDKRQGISSYATQHQGNYFLQIIYENHKEKDANSELVILNKGKFPFVDYRSILYGLWLYNTKYNSLEEIDEPDALEKKLEPDPDIVNKTINFSLNLISLIMARNIVTMRTRTQTSGKDYNKINRKRRRDGKRPFCTPLKEFYWIAIKPTEYDPRRQLGEREINCRFWVIGHLHRYWIGEGREVPIIRYIAPYIKGPEDAPWKENRYAVLEENMRAAHTRQGCVVRQGETQ